MKRTGLPRLTWHYALWPSDVGGNDIELRNPGVFMLDINALQFERRMGNFLNVVAASST